MNYTKHETACIDEPCNIGEGTKVWHFTHILKGAQIGRNCVVGQNVSIAGSVKIGNGVKVQNNVSLYDGATIEDYVFLGPSCVFTNVTNPRSEINRHGLYEKTLIKRGASIGANATIVCGTTIGRYAFIGAGAVVCTDVPDYALMIGVPAKQTGWMSRHGYPMTEPDSNGIYHCPQSNLRYIRCNNSGLKCIDLDEEETLPEHLKSCSQPYHKTTDSLNDSEKG